MRGAIVKTTKAFIFTLSFCFAFTLRSYGQEHDRFEGWCDSLQNASSPDLVQFLKAVAPDENNARCVTLAIHRLAKERYEPAVDSLAKLLDFRRPKTPQEKLGFYLRPQVIGEIYPAANALEIIGKKALPAVLSTITASSSSETARDNAVSVWMEIYRQSDGQPKAVGLLKQEEIKTKDEAIKQRLRWAVQKALTHCNPPEESACREAARTGIPDQVPPANQ